MKISAAADVVRARWADCRAKAQDESRPYRFSVIPDSGRFKIESRLGGTRSSVRPRHAGVVSDLESGGQGSSGSNHSSGDSGHGFLMEDSLPDRSSFWHQGLTLPQFSGWARSRRRPEYVAVAVFMPDGTAQDDVEINFGAHGAASVVLRLEAVDRHGYDRNNMGAAIDVMIPPARILLLHNGLPDASCHGPAWFDADGSGDCHGHFDDGLWPRIAPR